MGEAHDGCGRRSSVRRKRRRGLGVADGIGAADAVTADAAETPLQAPDAWPPSATGIGPAGRGCRFRSGLPPRGAGGVGSV